MAKKLLRCVAKRSDWFIKNINEVKKNAWHTKISHSTKDKQVGGRLTASQGESYPYVRPPEHLLVKIQNVIQQNRVLIVKDTVFYFIRFPEELYSQAY